ncbi:MAG: hypothetical protein WAR37_03220 [Candidatus Microsaccharimonas sp.]
MEQFNRVASMVKVNGILSIIFGAIGSLVGLIFMGIWVLSLVGAYSDEQIIGAIALFVGTLLFWVLPHVYLIISGFFLLRLPKPTTVKVFLIVNLVVGALANLVLLIFSIISLAQVGEYEAGYTDKKTT